MRPILLFSFLLLQISSLLGQGTSKTQRQPLQVNINKDLDKVYVHTVQSKETLYSLARVFDLPAVYLAKINGIEKDQILSIGTQLYIPIKDSIIKDVKTSPEATPVVYVVQPKETIFRIARIYFDKEIEQIQRLNNLTELKLDIGQILQVGWIELKAPVKLQDIVSDNPVLVDTLLLPNIQSSETLLDSLFGTTDTGSQTLDTIAAKPARKMTYKRGIAFWNKNSSSTELFVMHAEAAPQTEIELYNPITNQRVIATVVAALPPNTYPADINLVMSPKVARQLGALDSRFAVEMKYYK